MTEVLATSAATEAPKAAPKPRAPKLVAFVNGVEYTLLKYPFPVKSPRFPVTFNGVTVEAANTGGKGKQYTYFLVNNTSFYVPGTFAPDSVVTATFPEGYVFDEAVTGRVSTYKPKVKKDAASAEVHTHSRSTDTPAADVAPVHPDDIRDTDKPSIAEPVPNEKSKRRGK